MKLYKTHHQIGLNLILSFLRWSSMIILITLFCYWGINAFKKLTSEPISTRIENKYGDDDMGNLIMPAISLCRPSESISIIKSLKCLYNTSEPFYVNAINCIEVLGNVTHFMNGMRYENPMKCKLLQ